jgi:DNA-binding HxlR family transcriptional regulator
LQVLQQMQSETRSRLDAMGKVQEVASVSRRALRERLSDVTDATLRQRLKRLVDAGAIEMDRHTVRVIFNVTQNVTGT